MKKILLIADVRGWAFDYIAQYLVSLLEGKYDIDIVYIDDYKTPEEFLDYLATLPQIDLIHFFYRITLIAYFWSLALYIYHDRSIFFYKNNQHSIFFFF